MSKHLRTEDLDEMGLQIQNSIKKMKIDTTTEVNNQLYNESYSAYLNNDNANNASCNLNMMMEYEQIDEYYKQLKEMNHYLGYLHKLKLQRLLEKSKMTNNISNDNYTSISDTSNNISNDNYTSISDTSNNSSEYEPMDI